MVMPDLFSRRSRVGELGAVVERDGLSLLLWNTLQVLERKRSQKLGIHLGEEKGDEVPIPSIDQSHNAHSLVSSHERVTFCISSHTYGTL